MDAYWLKTGKGERTGKGKDLSEIEKLLVDAFPHLEPGVKEIWLSSARATLEAMDQAKHAA